MAVGLAVNGGDVAPKLPVLAALAVDGELGLDDAFLVALGTVFVGLAESGTDELRVRGIKVFAQLLDEMNEILLVPAGMCGIVVVLVALPEEEPRDLAAGKKRPFAAYVEMDYDRKPLLQGGAKSERRLLCGVLRDVSSAKLCRRFPVRTLLCVSVGQRHTAHERKVSSMNKADERFFQKHFPPEEFAARRERLLKEAGPESHVLLRGRSEPHGPRFLQSKVFFYLSGIEIPNALLMISGPEQKTTLYLPHRDPERHPEETGLGVEDAEEIKAATGVDDVCNRAQLAEHLAGMKTLYVQDAEDELPCRTRFEAMSMARQRAEDPWDGRPSDNEHFISLVKTRAGNIEVKSLTPIISEMRRVKSEREIKVLRRAGHLSALATTEAMRMTKVGLVERQLSAVASYIYYTHGATGEGYPQIIAAGNNMQFGHYSRGDATLADGDIVLVDTAPDYGYYTSDIGRIWPVNGTYAPCQRELYDYITTYHKTLLALLKPGAMAADIVAEAARIMAGVVKKTDFSKEIYKQAAERVLQAKHPLSHPVGLAVHDGSPYKHKPLEPGVVLSVDPMMTVPEEELYIRAEDTVLITEDGIENLTGDAPLEADDIEATMKEDGRFPLYDKALEWDPGRKM